MSLEPEFFFSASERRELRDKEGMSHDEVISALKAYDTTIYPVAVEVAQWVYENWTMSKVFSLPNESQKVLFEILDKQPINYAKYSIEKLRIIDTNNITPLEALSIINDLKLQITGANS